MAPPMTATPFMTPIAVGTNRLVVRFGTTAIAVGKIGPRKNPSRTKPALAIAAAGATQASTALAVTPARHANVMLAEVDPIQLASGLIRNRPRVNPSQYPLM